MNTTTPVRRLIALCGLLLLIATPLSSSAQESLDPAFETTSWQKFFYYFPSRVLDFADIFRAGVAFGPGFGGELAFTEKHQIGNYVANETGFGWYGSAGNRKIVGHSGYYKTKVKGDDDTRLQNKIDESSRFMRGRTDEKEYDLRGEFAFGLIHPYLAIDFYEIGDFFAGLASVDPRNDDMKPDAYVDSDPPRKLGRGLANLLTGIGELPKNVLAIDKGHGGVAAVTWGTALGLKRFLIREAVGLYEIATFPAGGGPMIEPEFPFTPNQSDTGWRLRRSW